MTEPKTVTVRIAVAIDPHGGWNAVGASTIDDGAAMDLAIDGVKAGEARYWVTAALPIPEPQEIAGTVETAGDA